MFKLKSVNVHKPLSLSVPLSPFSSPPSSSSSSSLTCSLCPLYKNTLCLIIGLIIGIRFTDIWFNLQNETLATILPPNNASSLSERLSSLDNDNLFNKTRVLCWVLTHPNNHLTKAKHILHTWGRRCNKLLFMSTEESEVLQTVKLDVKEGRDNLWNKTRMALKYIYDHHIDDAEWFLKADDDTYVIMENLRYFLYQYPSEAAIYFGAKFKRFIKQGYMSGGAGYVLSKESLKKFVSEAYDNPAVCSETYPAEDVQLGFCLQNIGVIAGDSRDDEGKERFLPLPIDYLIPEDKTWWYKNYSYYSPQENATCCSSSVITFHYIKPQQFYVLDYFLYDLKIFGIYKNDPLPKKLTLSDIISRELENFRPLSEPPYDMS